MIYLASPYSHASNVVRLNRYMAVCEHAASLIRSGYIVFSPIAHAYSICEFGDLPRTFDFWERQDHAFLELAASMTVLMLKGWEDSVGVQKEIEIMKGMGKPVFYEEFMGKPVFYEKPYGEETK